MSFMDCNKFEGSQKLNNLAEQLRLYKPPVNYSNDQSHNPNIKYPRIPKTEDDHVNLISDNVKNSTITNQHEKLKSNDKAAVLICLFEGIDGDLRVILTKRSSTLSSHSGEVALPGGKFEEGDANDIETALREAKEEIGLDPSLVNVVTVLESFTTKRGVSAVPLIGVMRDKNAFNPVANAAEVEEIFDAPLEIFLKNENRREVEREWMGEKYALHFIDHEAENKKFVIWALTAGILIRAASIVYQRSPAFQERRPNFWNRSASDHASLLD